MKDDIKFTVKLILIGMFSYVVLSHVWGLGYKAGTKDCCKTHLIKTVNDEL